MKKSLLADELRGERAEALGVAVGELLRLDPERVRRVGDRLAVLVGPGQEEDVLAALAVVAGHARRPRSSCRRARDAARR